MEQVPPAQKIEVRLQVQEIEPMDEPAAPEPTSVEDEKESKAGKKVFVAFLIIFMIALCLLASRYLKRKVYSQLRIGRTADELETDQTSLMLGGDDNESATQRNASEVSAASV